MNEREKDRRAKCRVSINKEKCEVLGFAECTEEVYALLREKGLHIETPANIGAQQQLFTIRVNYCEDLPAIQATIDAWVSGESYSAANDT